MTTIEVPLRPVRRLQLAPKTADAFVVYRGPSAINGAPIVAILTGTSKPSANAKTGPMAQLWILSADEAPHMAQRTGADESVCGNCPMRPALAPKGSPRCYVATFQGPLSTWKARRELPVDLAGAVRAVTGRALRLGAYGDPAAIPESSGVVQALCASASTHTGYTHQWRQRHAQWLRGLCMASLDAHHDVADVRAANAQGWRTFRVLSAVSAEAGLASKGPEVVCPYVTRGTQCVDCGLCSGASKAKSIAIAAH